MPTSGWLAKEWKQMRTKNRLSKETISISGSRMVKVEAWPNLGGSIHVIRGEDKYKQALWSVCFRANQNALQLTKLLHRCAFWDGLYFRSQHILYEEQDIQFSHCIVVCGCRLWGRDPLLFISVSVSENFLSWSNSPLSLLPTSTADDAVRENQNEPGKVCQKGKDETSFKNEAGKVF